MLQFAYQMRLKLTIIVTTLVEHVPLIELIDESNGYLKGGHLVLNPAIESNMDESYFDTIQMADDRSKSKSAIGSKSYLVVVPLSSMGQAQLITSSNHRQVATTSSSIRLQPVQMRLRVYCETSLDELPDESQKKFVVRRIRESNIEVPKFSTFILAPEQGDTVDMFAEEDPGTSCSANEQQLQHAKKYLMDRIQQQGSSTSGRDSDKNTLKMSFKLEDNGKLAQVSRLSRASRRALCFVYNLLPFCRRAKWCTDNIMSVYLVSRAQTTDYIHITGSPGLATYY